MTSAAKYPSAFAVPVSAPREETGAERPAAWLAAAVLVTAASFLVARYISLGPPQGPWAYWPISGLLCGILFHRPYREWLAIAIAAATAQIITIYAVRGHLASGATVVGALVEVALTALAAWALRRLCTGDGPLEHPHDLGRFVVVAVCLVPLIATPLSGLAFAMGLRLTFLGAWRPLFIGNSLSMLLFAPPLMYSWRAEHRRGPWRAGGAEVAAIQVSILAAAVATFTIPTQWGGFVALPYAMFPLLAWSAIRCGPRWTSVAIVGIATLAAWFTARGHGPFAPPGVALSDRVLQLEVYLAFVAFTGLLLSALSEQGRRSFERLAVDASIREGFFESSAALILLKDLAGRYVLVNEVYTALVHRLREEVVGRSTRDFMSPQEAALAEVRDQRVLERGTAVTFDETYLDAGVPRSFVVTRFPVRNAYGAISYIGVVGREVTAERRLTERLQQAQRVELIGSLAAGLAHDLNNRLTTIVISAGLLEESQTLSAEDRELLGRIGKAAASAGRLTKRLLSFGQASTPEPVDVGVDATLRELEPMLRVIARGLVDLNLALGAPNATIHADPALVEQVVLNLVANARDAIAVAGTITVATEVVPEAAVRREPGATRRAAKWVRLTVSDTGSGMDEAALRQIFEPFYSTKGDRGTGLGLYTASVLVREAGGVIDASSTPGAGTTFTVDLPVGAERSREPGGS